MTTLPNYGGSQKGGLKSRLPYWWSSLHNVVGIWIKKTYWYLWRNILNLGFVVFEFDMFYLAFGTAHLIFINSTIQRNLDTKV